MNEHTMNIDDLISQYIDGELSGDAEAELHHRLSVAPDDRKRFREQIMLRGIAADRRMLDRPAPAMRSALFARLQDEGLSAAAVALAAPSDQTGTSAAVRSAPAASPTTTSSLRQKAGDRPPVAHRQRRRRLVPMLLPFVVGVIATAGLWQLLDDESPDASKQIAMVDSAPASARPQSSGPYSLPADPATDAGVEEMSPDAVDGSSAAEPGAAGQAAGGELAAATAQPDAVASPVDEAASDAAVTLSEGSSRTSSASRLRASGSSTFRDAATPRDASRPRSPIRREVAISDAPEEESLGYGSMGSGQGRPMRDGDAFGDAPPMTISAPPSDASESPARLGAVTTESIEKPAMSKGAPSDDDARRDAPATESKTSTSTTAAEGATPKSEGIDSKAMAMSPPSAPPLDDSAHGGLLSERRTKVARGRADLGSAPIDFSDERGTVLASTLRQSLLVAIRSGDLHPELALRIGGELGDGTHEIFGTVGYTTIRQSQRTTSTEYRRVPGSQPVQELIVGERSSIDETLQAELWGGAGYRMTVVRGEHLRVGAGGWAAYGERYARVGAEIPVAYQISKNVRVELTPTIQYAKAHGATVRDIATTSIDLTSDTRQQTTKQSEVSDSEVRAGVGLGVTVVME